VSDTSQHINEFRDESGMRAANLWNPAGTQVKVAPVYPMPKFPNCSSASLSSSCAIIVLVLLIVTPAALFADSITGTIHDPSGAVIAGAHVEISGGSLTAPLVLQSDGAGKFSSPELPPGTYTVSIARPGFETLVKKVELKGQAQLDLSMEIARKEVSVAVSGKPSAFANTDPVYHQLRTVAIGDTFRLDGFSLTEDVATFQFTKGTLTLLSPIEGVVTGAIFVGEGHFHLKPFLRIDTADLKRRTGADEFDDDFGAIIFRFGANGVAKFKAALGERTETPGDVTNLLSHWRDHMRERHESANTFSEYLTEGEYMDNVDADVLAAVYNPKHPPFLNAYMHAKKHKDLRFFVRARVGAIPQLETSEEVALLNLNDDGYDDGILYLAHLNSEFAAHTANSSEDRRLFATHGYKIETVIAKNHHLYSSASITFEALVAGERVMKFGLLPNLRVSRVLDDTGHELYYIQENRKDDGSFYVVLPQAPPLGKPQTIQIEYAGDKVIEVAGEGSFYVSARTAWYPNLNGFGEKASYDLTFKVPKKFKVISVGKLQGESVEQDLSVSHWVTPVPVAVAGFNYGDYKRIDMTDDKTGYKISGFYLQDLPDILRPYPAAQSLAPKSMTDYALSQTRAQIQICTFYFGKSPYDQIYITEQPNFNFGQSWPNLVYLPISAYTDSTQRYMLFGGIQAGLSGFVQEVTPHEVAHQWWGHAVSWASYHDQWLSEGFAEFSAGLFLQQGMGGDWRKDYVDFWERLRKRVLEKNKYGLAPNDAGPIWLGLRLISVKQPDGYQNVTYPKGAYVLQMLRSMMYSSQDGDKRFIAMMHDFVEAHRQEAASTESFKQIAEKHMTKAMDLDGNGRLDWFFSEWVYGTEVPRYRFEYQTSPADGGKVKLHMTVTQSDVNQNFAMMVPLFADFGKGMGRLGQVTMVGNTSQSIDIVLPSQPKKVALNAYKEVLER
jgi:hypothetical protein